MREGFNQRPFVTGGEGGGRRTHTGVWASVGLLLAAAAAAAPLDLALDLFFFPPFFGMVMDEPNDDASQRVGHVAMTTAGRRGRREGNARGEMSVCA